MQTRNVSIISIHPDPAQPLGLDVKHVLEALEPCLAQWIWCARNLDWLGANDEPTAQPGSAAESARWMTSKELLGLARNVYQTIEGELYAFPRSLDPKQISERETDLREFGGSRAALALTVVDGGFIEVYAKDPHHLDLLRGFKDVRDENSDNYF